MSARDLPEGVALFLKRVNGSGSVMNHPDTGGYYEWELYPRYKIFMDLQVPFLFPAEDFETARNVYVDQRALRKVITRYRPDFIAVPIGMQGFKTLIADHPQYHLIFFDDAEVLYGDSSRKPDPDLATRDQVPGPLCSLPIGAAPRKTRFETGVARAAKARRDVPRRGHSQRCHRHALSASGPIPGAHASCGSDNQNIS